MNCRELTIPFKTSVGKIGNFRIYEESKNSLFLEEKEIAISNNEPVWQILEGRSYEYILDESYYIEPSDIVSPSRVQKFRGRLSPNIYVGTLTLHIFDEETKESCAVINIEVRSVKTDYRTDYRQMLADITEKCTELLMQHSSPVSQTFTVDHSHDAQTLYQRFSFLRSVIESEDFDDAVHKIISAPVTQWTETEINKDIRAIRKTNSKIIRQIAGGSNRIELPEEHRLFGRFQSIPRLVNINYKKETVDTPENRFIKYAIQSFLTFSEQLKLNPKASARLISEASILTGKLDQILGHSVFREISRPTTLPLNSPVLQKKEGYREILRIWLMFDLAAKLVWQGGEDVYSGGKKDIAVLYEYWLFFKLLELLKDVFKIEPKKIEELIKPTNDGLGLQLKQGRFIAIDGVFETETRKLKVEFSYNKSFSGNIDYPAGGSWSTTMRPDYTLSIWPNGISQDQAEIEELIVHIHFDAKYKIEKLTDVFYPEPDLDEEKIEQKKGTFKRADILKMHSYRDAIRRTAGAYILYPGTESKNKSGFHEILPGLGAFAISPAKRNNGTNDLKKFLYDVIDHFLNRASQREKIAYKTYETFKDKPLDTVNERLPETIKENRNFIPDDTFVLIGFCKDEEYLDWYRKNRIYNARTESVNGSLNLGIGESTARYLLLHIGGKLVTSLLFKIIGKGPQVFSSQKLIDLKYPNKNPQNPFYLVYKIDPEIEPEFMDASWDISKLKDYRAGRQSAIPFSVTLSELMKVKIKK